MNRAPIDQAAALAVSDVVGDALLPISAVIEATGSCRSAVYGLMRAGDLGFVQRGARRLVPASELRRFLEAEKSRAIAEGTLQPLDAA